MTRPNYVISKPEISTYITEYPTQASTTTPNAIAVDANENVWFSLWNLSSIAELIPSNGTIHEYHVPGLKAGAMLTWGLAVDNTRHLVWFTEFTTNSIWSFNMTNDKFTQYPIPTQYSQPFYLALDQNHDVWFTELSGNKIGEITPQGNLTEFTIPQSGDLEASGITVDSTGRVWFTLAGTDSIGSYYQGKFTIDNLTGVISTPVGISVGSNGDVWFTQHGPSFISEFIPDNDTIRTISTSNNSLITSLPYFIWVDSNNNVWFNEHQGNAMSEFIPTTDTMVEYFIPTAVVSAGNISYALTSTLSSTGQPWFTELISGKVGTVNTSKPLDVAIDVLNDSDTPLSIPVGGEISLGLSVSSESEPVTLYGYVGNFTNEGNFTFSFSPKTGNGNFSSAITIRDAGAMPGNYFITVNARTNSLAVSRIVEINVP